MWRGYAARGLCQGAKKIKELDLFQVPSFAANVENAKDMIPYVKEARDEGGLVVFTFHGVGGDYLLVSPEDHNELLYYLKENENDYWVAPFREVIQHITDEKERLGWQ